MKYFVLGVFTGIAISILIYLVVWVIIMEKELSEEDYR